MKEWVDAPPVCYSNAKNLASPVWRTDALTVPCSYLSRSTHGSQVFYPAPKCKTACKTSFICQPWRNMVPNCDYLLPKDPRQWTREHVACWLQHVITRHQLPSVQLDRFLMNGKALCLMSMEMFVHRVPLGGKLLYKDFQLRLSTVLYS
ncbi:ETS-like protein pointed isoform X2 [Limulus polyphemus]|uniref:ETS-like protein pointed isoform X2 n=1 Tax=Limulus polyphemus TaxID=6850 RepID=A0ABM1S8G0_LIMPO|nr:ETS-like protein pointed isoform X2 [Limulus polyphemus]